MINEDKTLKWIETNGGPIVILPRSLKEYWSGQQVDSSGLSDYDRACNVINYIDKITVGSGIGFVLGGDPCPTAALISPVSGHFIIARWVWAESDDEAEKILTSSDLSIIRGDLLDCSIGCTEIILADSAFDGMSKYFCLSTHEINAGNYIIETFDYKPNQNTWFIIHIFKYQN